MERTLENIQVAFGALRLLPHLLIKSISRNGRIIDQDIDRWNQICRPGNYSRSTNWSFLWLMTRMPEYRNLYYHRTGLIGKLFAPLCRPMNTLFIATKEIGPGLFIQHGFATIIAAKSIGKNCWINQQVTVGYSSKGGQPSIGDNVTINAGAKIIGDVSVGDDCVVGANAVVVKSIPPGSTAVGVPAKVIKIYGVSSGGN